MITVETVFFLLRDCWTAMAEQARALDRRCLGDGPLKVLNASEMDALDLALRRVMGLA